MKRTISVFLALLTVLALALPSFSAYVSSNYSLNTELAKRIRMLESDEWIAVSGVESIRTRTSGSNDVLFISAEAKAKKMSVSYEPRRFPSLEEYNELSFDVKSSTKGNVNYYITFYYSGKSFTDSAENVSPERRLVRFKLPEDASKNYERIVFTVSSCDGDLINSCSVLAVHADNFRSYSYIDRFASNRVEMPHEATGYDEFIEVVPASEDSSLKCILEKPLEGEDALVTLRVYSPYTGILTVRNDETDKAQTTAMYKGEATYNFIVSGLGKSITVGFSAGEADSGEAVRFISMTPTALKLGDSVYYGNVDSCLYDGKKVTVKGSIPSEIAVKYIKSKLALYKIPYDSGEDYELSEPEAEMRISTSFTLSASVDYDHTRYRYVVGIVEKKRVLPLTTPLYAFARSSNKSSVSQGCEIGLSKTDAVTVFSSGADRVVLNVEHDSLISSEYEAGRNLRITYHDKVFFLDAEQINQLASEISFYSAAGKGVYLRIKQSAEHQQTEEDKDAICACAAYFSEHYPEIDGVILSAGMKDTDDLIADAKSNADMLALFKGAVRISNTECSILVSADETSASRTVMMAYYNKHNGVDGVGLFYECGSGGYDVSKAKALADGAAITGAAYSSIEMYCELSESVKEDALYSDAVKAGVSSVVLSADKMDSEYVINTVESLRESKSKIYEFGITDAPPQYTGEYYLWDFKNSYDTYGWLSGGSCRTPQTVRASIGEGRAMRSIVSPEAGECGMLVRWLDNTTDISCADMMSISLYAENGGEGSIPVSVILGSASSKAEYSAELGSGEIKLTLDLGAFTEANKLEYVAIILDAEKEVRVELYDVRLLSEEKTDDELKATMAPYVEQQSDIASVYIFFGALISATVIIFAILTKKKNGKK